MPDAPMSLVSIDWLADHRDEVRVIDVRDPWEYEGIGHIPGAVNIPFDVLRRHEGDEGMLPGVDQFNEVMSNARITPADTIIAYDDEHGVFAARILVTALMYGHDSWALLDGDYSAWSRTNETSRTVPDIVPSNYSATITDDRPLIDAAAVLAAADDPDAVLVDTRTAEEFNEGHIKSAVQLDWRELVDPDTRGTKPDHELLELLAEYGITPDKRVVLYCNTARRISHTYIVLRHLGFDRVDFYEGSLTDWNDRGLDLQSASS